MKKILVVLFLPFVFIGFLMGAVWVFASVGFQLCEDFVAEMYK